jgi:hypothetical protein
LPVPPRNEWMEMILDMFGLPSPMVHHGSARKRNRSALRCRSWK